MKHTFNLKTKYIFTCTAAGVLLCTGLFLFQKAQALSAEVVCKQQTIFGFVGTKSCVGQEDGNGAGNVVPTVGNLAAVDDLPTMPAAFSATAPTFDYSKICSNQNILGTAGTAACALRYAMNHVDKGNSTSALSENYAASAPVGRLVPMNKDDDGQNGTNVIKFDRTGLNVCGTAATTLANKIADCVNRNPLKSNWLGTKGNSGQGNWTLVQAKDAALADGTACGTCTEIWRDDRTGLLWSDSLATDKNWCWASGSTLGTICSDTSNQPATPESLCAEGNGRNVDATYDAAKGNLRATGTTINVRWWLPTRYDWMQAEENGIRFVLPNINVDFWTASANSTDLTEAWIFKNATNAGGGFETILMTNTSTSTRCIGQPL